MVTIAGGTVSGDLTAGEAGDAPRGAGAFEVHLDVFEGPFDLLLGLISKHKLDITEVALSQVTDEFIAYIRQRSGGWDLDQVSYFLVVAATLLDLKAARLLPSGEVEDEEDLALLEARDLLFARLLQYRAYKEAAAVFAGRMAAAAKRFPRRVPLEPRFAELLPEVLFAIGPQEFAALAARALAPKAPPTVSVDHIHAAFVSIREQAVLIAGRLRGAGPRVVPAAVVGRGGQLRDRRVVPRPARAVPRGRGGVRAGVAARRAVRHLDRRRPRGEAGPAGRQTRRRAAIGTGNRRRRLHMTSDFTEDDSATRRAGRRGRAGRRTRRRRHRGPTPRPTTATTTARGLRASLEAILLVADEPVPEVLLAQVLERPRREVADGLRALAAEYTDRRPRLRPAGDSRRLALLYSGGLRAARRAVRQGRPGGPAHPGGA